MTISTVYQPPVTFAFSAQEIAAMREAVYYRALDVANMRRLYELVDSDVTHDAELSRKQQTLDGLIAKLGPAPEGDEE